MLAKVLRLAKPEAAFQGAKGLLNNPALIFNLVVAPLLIWRDRAASNGFVHDAIFESSRS